MIILGMDPSIRNWGIVRTEISRKKEIKILEAVVIHTSAEKRKISPADKKTKYRKEKIKAASDVYKNVELLNRGRHIIREAFSFIEQADFIFVELPVGAQSATACVNYGMCVGLFAAIAEIGIPYEVIRNNEIKKKAGYGDSEIRPVEKDEIITYVRNAGYQDLFKNFKKGEHEHLADALMSVLVGVEKYGDVLIPNFYDNN